MADDQKPWRVEILKRERLLDRFFKVDQVTVSHEKFNGEMSEPFPYLVLERGDAVAALLYDPERRKVIAVNQFRLPTRDKGQRRGWLIEAVAGMMSAGEKPEQTLVREVEEETGYQLTQWQHISTFFSSPGGTSELIYLYYAEVRSTNKTGKGGGISDEDIDVVEYDIDQFFQLLNSRAFEDPKLIIAGQWLQAQRGSLRAEYNPGESRTFQAVLGSKQVLGIKTGDIAATTGAEVWVNSENTDMMMERFFGRSISATIRSRGAQKNADGSIYEDTIGKALAAEMGPRSFVKIGTVLQTTAGELSNTHNVRAIFHVASVAGKIGQGLSTSIDHLELALENVLEAVSHKKYRSVLVPLIGTGHGGYPVSEVAPRLVNKAHEFLTSKPRSALKEVYFLAYSQGDLEVLKSAIKTASTFDALEVKTT